MERTDTAYAQLIERIAAWARGRPDLRAVLVIGSRARSDYPADPWSDLDVVLVTTDPDVYLAGADWLEALGTVWITFLEPTAVGGQLERRVLFAGGLDVDFSVVPYRDLVMMERQGLPPEVGAVLRRGVRTLLDRDGCALRLEAAARLQAASVPAPTQADFDQLCHDFWYHAVWVAKKLRRGEIWTALMCCDGYMKRRLLTLVEWHARAGRGPHWDTWHAGRFLERWADPRVLQGLRGAFGHYDAGDVRRALVATMDLFRWVAAETAGLLGLKYPAEADARATELVLSLLPGVD